MSAVSGFDPLFSSLEEQGGETMVSHHVPAELPTPALHKRIIARLGSGGLDSGNEISPFVEARHFRIAKECLAILEHRKDDLLVLSAGENQFASCLAGADPAIRKRIYLFLHQPPAWFRLHWREPMGLSGLGGIFSLCTEQATFLRDYSGSPVHLIRHGVCHDYFTPGDTPQSAPERLLFVGQWLRDFDTLAKTIPLILSERPGTLFDLVVPHSARQRECLYPLAMRPEVAWYAGISPDALRALYRNATALLLPLVDSTANNAILEAMACGLPIITTAVGGSSDYLPATAGIFCKPGDADSHARAALKYLQDRRAARAMGRAGRIHAGDHLTWQMISGQVMALITSA